MGDSPRLIGIREPGCAQVLAALLPPLGSGWNACSGLASASRAQGLLTGGRPGRRQFLAAGLFSAAGTDFAVVCPGSWGRGPLDRSPKVVRDGRANGPRDVLILGTPKAAHTDAASGRRLLQSEPAGPDRVQRACSVAFTADVDKGWALGSMLHLRGPALAGPTEICSVNL